MTEHGHHEVAEAFRLGDFLVRICYESNSSFGYHYLVVQREAELSPEPQTLLVHHIDDLKRIVKASELLTEWLQGDRGIAELASGVDVIGARQVSGDVSLKRTEPPHYPEWVQGEAI